MQLFLTFALNEFANSQMLLGRFEIGYPLNLLMEEERELKSWRRQHWNEEREILIKCS